MQSVSIDYSRYLVTDRGRSTLESVQAAVPGGVSCVQLREKTAGTREFVAEARSIQAFLKAHRVPLIINDRLDVALAVVSAIAAADDSRKAAADLRKTIRRAGEMHP